MNRFRKMMSAALAGCMAVSALMMSAGAANTNTAAEREKVIYGSQAWTVNGAAAIQHSDGTVEQVPEFSALYPGWTVPKQTAAVSSAALAEAANIDAHAISGYYRNVYLTRNVNYKPFYSFLGNGETVSAFAVTIPGSRYNLGIYNETAQQDAGWLQNLSKGDRVLLQTANGVYYSIRASVPSNMPFGYSRMKVETTEQPMDKREVDWSKADRSMLVSGKDYHRYAQSNLAEKMASQTDKRYYHTGWVYGVPKLLDAASSLFAIPGIKDLTFQSREAGVITVWATDTTSGIQTANMIVFDVTSNRVSDCVTLQVDGAAKSFAVDPTHAYRFYPANDRVSGASVRYQISVV